MPEEPLIVLCDAAIAAGQRLDSDSWTLVERRDGGWWAVQHRFATAGDAMAAGFDLIEPDVAWSATTAGQR